MKNKVCAVVVTCNRSQLLRECLTALNQQSRLPNRVVVVDNASTDDTCNMLAREFAGVDVVALPRNLGSSGGFTAGIQWAHSQKYEWIWTLDDDTFAEPDALLNLMEAHDRFPDKQQPVILASKVVWTDGKLHPMNIQKPKLYDPQAQFLAASCATMSIRFTSFVSMLIHRSCIQRYGLPIADYFLWNDDVEFTASILRGSLGVMVPASQVVHATDAKYVPAEAVGARFFYEVRNKLWILRRSDAFSHDEKWWMAKSLVKRAWNHLVQTRFSRDSLDAVISGLWHGLILHPRKNQDVMPASIEAVGPVPGSIIESTAQAIAA